MFTQAFEKVHSVGPSHSRPSIPIETFNDIFQYLNVEIKKKLLVDFFFSLKRCSWVENKISVTINMLR